MPGWPRFAGFGPLTWMHLNGTSTAWIASRKPSQRQRRVQLKGRQGEHHERS